MIYLFTAILTAIVGVLVPIIGRTQSLHLQKYSGLPQTITRIRVASASILPTKWDKTTNWLRIETMVRRAVVEGGAEVVVTPEGALEGYVVNEVNNEKNEKQKVWLQKQFLTLGEPIDGPYIQKAQNLCDELEIYLVLGFLERRNQKLFNSAILIDPDGDIIGRYSKTHFAQGYTVNPDEYKPGDEYPVIDTPFGKVGMLICYDRQLPEPARIMALKGAQALFVPAFGSYTDRDGWNTVLLRTRAYENRFPVVFSHPYQSLLIAANGELRAVGNANEIVYFEMVTNPERYKNRFANRRARTYRFLIDQTERIHLP